MGDDFKQVQELLKRIADSLTIPLEEVVESQHKLLDILQTSASSKIALPVNEALMDPANAIWQTPATIPPSCKRADEGKMQGERAMKRRGLWMDVRCSDYTESQGNPYYGKRNSLLQQVLAAQKPKVVTMADESQVTRTWQFFCWRSLLRVQYGLLYTCKQRGSLQVPAEVVSLGSSVLDPDEILDDVPRDLGPDPKSFEVNGNLPNDFNDLCIRPLESTLFGYCGS
ncbi:hypothetical protein UY3_03443 [Chelonia mydas]|uniref:Uncharacterized protein n=1 Tax=Chelonia mydas TaxID=8469 RepID=M7BN82_CHEMY|nr:hypothetical protein UY3_03443 [Chelonia mydas]